METDLHRGLENEEFALCFQPKIDTQTRTIRGVEALVRWHHPQRGFVTEAAPLQRILNPIEDPANPPPVTPARWPPMWDYGLMDAVPDTRVLAQPEPASALDY